MYRYDEFDATMVRERVSQFRGQVERRLAGDITEEAFKPLRLMNGLYLQLHAYMLRVAIPYGTLNARQMRKLAHVARVYDKGYGHFTTRQNIQNNWPALVDVPDILDTLAEDEMHAIQTSGNCIRNVTTDQFAGAAADEIEDPRPWCEVIRQWSTFHPEFSFLPRKFKIAVTGSPHDRAAIGAHDIGIRLVKNEAGEVGFEIHAGGGQGRTPRIAVKLNEFVAQEDLLAYLTAILRVYNLAGRRDNKFKARIKILVEETGPAEFARQVEDEFARIRGGELVVPREEIERIAAFFTNPPSDDRAEPAHDAPGYAAWRAQNVKAHKVQGRVSIALSLKPYGGAPGDATADQMDKIADLADRYAEGEIRVTKEQNLILPHARAADLPTIYEALHALNLATPNAGLASDIVSCPGLDYCNLANTRSIPIAQAVSTALKQEGLDEEAGDLTIKISGCINACGHHHVANIGVLGVEKRGDEFYQLTLGGVADGDTAIGKILGPALASADLVAAILTIVRTYIDARRDEEETFIQTLTRLGPEPFKEAVYGAPH